jgi:hypothetical protein
MVIATIFGGIHCVGWSFEFPSHTEQLLWRIASIAITSAPLLIFTLPLVVYLDKQSVVPGWVLAVLVTVGLPSVLVYVIGRFVLLALPFMSLRSLPPLAYQTVHWTTFIPHI